eukprot:2666416-Lingulodinium_polyedra.AAC.1
MIAMIAMISMIAMLAMIAMIAMISSPIANTTTTAQKKTTPMAARSRPDRDPIAATTTDATTTNAIKPNL